MISKLRVQGFKRFDNKEFKLSPLTVLAGLNGAGKTSLIQSLLVTQQCSNSSVVQLNGPFGLELGTAEDVSNWAGAPDIRLTVDEAGHEHCWTLTWPAENSMYLSVTGCPETMPAAFLPSPRSFTYLCAERIGPRGSHTATAVPADQLEVGYRGEHCAQLLAELGNKPIDDVTRLHPNSEGAPFLKYEVERWLSAIARPVDINAERLSGANVYTLSFRDPAGTFVKAPNMGFGVTFALPVVLAGLIAQQGSVFIVENPEAHLHPAGQSHMGVFLAWLAGKGVQVIVETHSDHVLNGIRRAVGEFGFLPAKDAIVHFFGSGQEVPVQELTFTARGGISHWPAGFFDQFVLDTAALGRIRREGKGDGVRG